MISCQAVQLQSEVAPYYFTYINQVAGDDPTAIIVGQLDGTTTFLHSISEEFSRHRYAPDKWSIREVLSHISDAERLFAFRALWFARGFTEPLPSFDQNIAVAGAEADSIPWSAHIEEFRNVRQATISLFQNLPSAAWDRKGIASGYPFSVRALAFIIAGHLAHHTAILRTSYLA